MSSTGGAAGPTQITMGPNGIQLVLLKTKISALADLMTSMLGRPVVDRTRLTGDYQIALDIPQEEVQNVARALGMGGRRRPDLSICEQRTGIGLSLP
jgi:uncharacterized protein (TIGR03435 family)